MNKHLLLVIVNVLLTIVSIVVFIVIYKSKINAVKLYGNFFGP